MFLSVLQTLVFTIKITNNYELRGKIILKFNSIKQILKKNFRGILSVDITGQKTRVKNLFNLIINKHFQIS